MSDEYIYNDIQQSPIVEGADGVGMVKTLSKVAVPLKRFAAEELPSRYTCSGRQGARYTSLGELHLQGIRTRTI